MLTGSVGWLVEKALWGQGFATEAALAARDYCLTELGIRRLISLIRPVNVASSRVAAKVGMVIEKEIDWAGLPHLVYALDNTDPAR